MAFQGEQEEEQVSEHLTVFAGSSQEDVSHARRLWSSLSLLPPLESRLVSADTRQRLPVSRPQRPRPPGPQPPTALLADRQREEERRRYEAMADQRKEILALLGRQRQRRIRKEPQRKTCGDGPLGPPGEPDAELEKQLVQQLQ